MKPIDIRKYLPSTTTFNEEVVFNYLYTEKDQLVFGNDVKIKKDIGILSDVRSMARDSAWDCNDIYCIYFRDKLILNMINVHYPLTPTDYSLESGQEKLYKFQFINDPAIKFQTNNFRSFSIDETNYMAKNFFYEYVCIKFILKKLYTYVMSILELPTIKQFDVQFDSTYLKYYGSEPIHEPHKELVDYFMDNHEKSLELYSNLQNELFP